jgi:replicative DNA helicase
LVRKGISPDVIVIDYLNLIAAPEKGKNSYESIKAVTEQIRALSYHFNCPVVSATQTNRSAYGEANPGLETMSESMGLAHTADAQFSIWSEEGDIELGQIHLGVNKNRFGPIGAHTTLEIDYPTLTLRDSSNATVELTNKLNNKISSSITSSSLSDTFDLIEGLDID